MKQFYICHKCIETPGTCAFNIHSIYLSIYLSIHSNSSEECCHKKELCNNISFKIKAYNKYVILCTRTVHMCQWIMCVCMCLDVPSMYSWLALWPPTVFSNIGTLSLFVTRKRFCKANKEILSYIYVCLYVLGCAKYVQLALHCGRLE